jgi:hypothetical protein
LVIYSSVLASSNAPNPTLASPSVQITTVDPGAPWAAIAIELAIAGPRAVGPVSSSFISFSYNFFPDSAIVRFILSIPY